MTSDHQPVNLLVAVSRNGVIGRNGQLPWSIPSDLKWFKELTTGHVVIAGRVTQDEIMKRLKHPLPNRFTVVLSRSVLHFAPTVYTARDMDGAIQTARIAARAHDAERKIFVIGGVSVYRAAIPFASRLYLTRVLAEVEGDTVFPDSIWQDLFQLTEQREVEPDPRDEYPIQIEVYDRKEASVD